MFCGTDSTSWNISHIQIECGEYMGILLVPQNIVMDLNNVMIISLNDPKVV